MSADGDAGTIKPTAAVNGHSVVRPVPWVRVAEQSDSVTFISGSRVVRYSGGATRLLPYVLPRMDGRSDLDAIVADLGLPQLAEPVMALCQRLLADGLAMEVDGVVRQRGERAEQLFDALASNERAADPFHVYVCGSVDEQAAIASTAPEHWQLSTMPLATLATLADQHWDEHTCAIVWVPDMNAPELAQWNELAYRLRLPWLPISQFDGAAAVVGPYVAPPQTACFECYRRRRAAHSRAGEVALAARPVGAGGLSTRAVTQVLAGLGVVMVHDWAARRSPFVPGAVRTVTFDEGMQVGTEYVLRVPRCAACRPAQSASRLAPWSEYLSDGDC